MTAEGLEVAGGAVATPGRPVAGVRSTPGQATGGFGASCPVGTGTPGHVGWAAGFIGAGGMSGAGGISGARIAGTGAATAGGLSGRPGTWGAALRPPAAGCGGAGKGRDWRGAPGASGAWAPAGGFPGGLSLVMRLLAYRMAAGRSRELWWASVTPALAAMDRWISDSESPDERLMVVEVR